MRKVTILFGIIALVALFFQSCSEENNSYVKATPANIDSLLKVYPDSVPLLVMRGKIKLDSLIFKVALSDAAKAFRLDSNNIDARMLYAKVQNNKPERTVSDVALAQRHFKYIISKQPKNTDALVQLATTYGYQQDFENAFLYVDRALRIDPKNRDAYVFKGSMFLLMDRIDLAKSSYETAVQQDPKFFEGYLRLGSIYESEKDSICFEYYLTAHKLQPKNPEGLYAMAYAKQGFEKYDDAKALYRQMMNVEDNSYYISRGQFHIAYIYQFFDRNLDSAIYYYNSATETEPRYIEAYHNLGLCYEEKGNKQQAVQQFSKALKINPNFELSRREAEKYRSVHDH